METILLLCEIIIGLVGIFTIITGRDTHDRMHGIFVVLLCIDGLCEHFFSHYSLITETSLGITALYGVFFIIFFSIDDIKERAARLKKKNKQK